jgi:hypothetical protein
MPTKRQLEILRLMRDTDEELVYEGRHAYIGNQRTNSATIMALLRLMALCTDQCSRIGEGTLERYTINETGLQILKDAGY